MIIIHRSHVKSINEAWGFLLGHGKALAESHQVQPQDLILGNLTIITSTGSIDVSLPGQ